MSRRRPLPRVAPALIIAAVQEGRPRRGGRAGRAGRRTWRRRRSRRRWRRRGGRRRTWRRGAADHVLRPVAGLGLVVEEQAGLAGLVVGHVGLHTPCKGGYEVGQWGAVRAAMEWRVGEAHARPGHVAEGAHAPARHCSNAACHVLSQRKLRCKKVAHSRSSCSRLPRQQTVRSLPRPVGRRSTEHRPGSRAGGRG